MTRTELIEARRAMVAEHGPWSFHNVALPYGLFTMGSEPGGDNWRIVKFLRLVADTLKRPFEELRVLDLGCGEGLYAIEFAQQGSNVIGVEGRPQHVAKADFCKRALGLQNVTFELGDVREVNCGTHGRFDVILCSGLLYHLDHPHVFELMAAMRGMCQGICIVDTSISPRADFQVQFGGHFYWGAAYREHATGLAHEEKMKEAGASLDNENSFWITKHDLVNGLIDLGFTSVFECLAPVPLKLRRGRVTLVASVGRSLRAHNEVGMELEKRRWPPLWGATESHPDEAGPPGP